jgi:hypothetical protein
MSTRDRERLFFAESVRRHFGFLEGRHFTVVTCTPTYVRYESQRLFVNVYHGRKSFEIGLEVGQLTRGRREEPYPISGIISLLDPERAADYQDYATRTAEGVDEGLRRLSALFREYAERGLFEDPGLFTRLQRQRQESGQRMARDVDLTHAREALGGLWRSRDYARVVQLLQPLRESLGPSELKKLEYAEKHIDDSSPE